MTHNLNPELEELLEELREYRADMVARNYPFQRISNIITVWEMKKVPKRDFLEEAEKEKKELEESYQESVRQAKERKDFHPKAIDGYGE
tara:strand:+ start:789 stop:1055 length:267 start_codon:yes stop_codon:yes gene_type:complete